MKLLFLTGSRGEWGYIRPILRLCEERGDVDYHICATNMHVIPTFGYSVDEIRADGFTVHDEIYMSLEGHNHFSTAKSLGVFLISFIDVLSRVRPDWLVLAGDRGEQLMGAIAAGYTYIPSAHIQAGELSGNIDGTARHALGKFAHIHFAANQDAADRLHKLGEEDFRIHNVGAPQLDELVLGMTTSKADLSRKYAFNLDEPYLLVVLHPVTEQFHQSEAQIRALSTALKSFDMRKIWILPNNDAGSEMIRRGISEYRYGRIHTYANLPRQDYLGFLKHALAMVGNSSSGLLEAPTFKVPAVNIGRRQHNRVQGENVINCEFNSKAIEAAVIQATSKEFRLRTANTNNPYGDGHSSERILDILLKTPRTPDLLAKQLTY